MDEQERAQYFGGFSSAQSSGADPLGYYALMGLEPTCTKQEIQVLTPAAAGPRFLDWASRQNVPMSALFICASASSGDATHR